MAETKPPTSNAVVSDMIRKRRIAGIPVPQIRLSRRAAYIVVAAIVILAGGGTVYWWHHHVRERLKHQTDTLHGLTQDLLQGTTGSKNQPSNNYAQNIKQLQEYISSNPPKDLKTQAYSELGDANVNAGNYTQALTAYKSAEQLSGSTISVVTAEAYAETKLGDKQAAIADYKRALSLVSSSDPMANTTTEELKQDITNLGGKP